MLTLTGFLVNVTFVNENELVRVDVLDCFYLQARPNDPVPAQRFLRNCLPGEILRSQKTGLDFGHRNRDIVHHFGFVLDFFEILQGEVG